MKVWFSIQKSINGIHCINRIKAQNTVISMQKKTDKIQQTFMIENTQKSRKRGKLPQNNSDYS